MITAYPGGDVGTPLGAPLVGESGESVVKDVRANSSEEKNESKSASSSSEEKKDEPHPID